MRIISQVSWFACLIDSFFFVCLAGRIVTVQVLFQIQSLKQHRKEQRDHDLVMADELQTLAAGQIGALKDIDIRPVMVKHVEIGRGKSMGRVAQIADDRERF